MASFRIYRLIARDFWDSFICVLVHFSARHVSTLRLYTAQSLPLCVFITVRCVSLCCSASHPCSMHHTLDDSNGSLSILKIRVGSVRHIWPLKKCSALNCGLLVCSPLACFCHNTYSCLTFGFWQQLRAFYTNAVHCLTYDWINFIRCL